MPGLVIRFLRRMFGIRSVVSRDDAMRIAQDHCINAGWPWRPPVYLAEGLYEYRMMTNTSMRGGNVNIRVRVTDGAVVSAAFARR